jgi:serine/threonine-protein kinase
MSDDIDALVAEERLTAAAELSAERGDHARASLLYERACAWDLAATEALSANECERALELAILGKNEAISRSAFEKVVAIEDASKRCADRLSHRGDHAWAARLYEAAKQSREAALAWSRAGEAARAAEILEAHGEPAEAARLLDVALKRSPENWSAALALGGLLLRYGKNEAATRALQSIPQKAGERAAALALLAQAFERMGLTSAAREANEELTKLGGVSLHATPTAAKVETKSRLFGRYDVVRLVASTASARVMECVDAVRHETVAMKLFANDSRSGGRDALNRFEREIKALQAIDHPNVVPMRDYFPDGPALVMEWMSGGTLESMMTRQTIAPARAVEIACAVLSALAEAHRLEILHRDVKPANVLFDGAGVTRLGDFGVAHLGDLSATATAGVIGTLAYMSPEQRRGEPATVESDVYGVGAMLFEMLTGNVPGVEIEKRRLPSGAHRDLGARHDSLVLSMLDDDPKNRPGGAIDARRALMALKWPTTVEPAAPIARNDETTDGDENVSRLRVENDGGSVDTWTARPIERIALDEKTRAASSLFARAGHSSLQTIFRIDRASNEIWLEAVVPLRSEIEPNSRADLARALESLREIGGASIQLDASTMTLVAARANGEPVIRLSEYLNYGSTIA